MTDYDYYRAPNAIADGFESAPKANRSSYGKIIPKQLQLSSATRTTIQSLIDDEKVEYYTYDYTNGEQDVANALFSRLGLHIPDVQYKEICAKMCIRQSTHKDRGTTGVPKADQMVQTRLPFIVLNDASDVQKPHMQKPYAKPAAQSETSWQRYERIYQCGCGTDHTEGGKHPKRNRQIAWPDLGCPCWIRLITMQGKTNTDTIVAILGISGVLTHSDACISKTDLENKPRFPLHPDVRNYALSLLRERAPISMVRAQCKKFAEARWGAAMGNIEFRYRLATHDSSSLYRSAAAEIGVPQRSKPEENLYAWFGPTPTPPTPEFTKSCLHYQPHISASENAPEQRFELVLATPQMQKAAWTYGHKKLVHMDLTFGVCSARTLLAILMASNPRGKGIPIAFIMFTARKSAKAVHADYDTAILTRLLEKFKQGMGVNELLEVFDIGVGVVDLDPREHSSLRTNWDLIFLLWCIFHVWQAWRNALNKYLLSIPKGDARQEVRKRLVGLLIPLMRDVIVYDEACRLYNDEITYFTALSKQRSVISRKQGTAGLSFLAYFKRYVKSYADWLPWSPAGPIKAAEILGVAPSDVPRTNNPLESFNGHIKGTYFLPYLHSGRLPRVDVWILLIITKVMPTFFADIDDKAAMMDYQAQIMKPNEKRNDSVPKSSSDSTISPFKTWLKEEEELVDDEDAVDDPKLHLEAPTPLPTLPAPDMDHVERPLSPLNDMHIDSLPDVPVHSSPFLPVDDVPLIDILRSPSNSVGSIVPETPPFSSPACSPIQKLLSPSDSVGSVVPETPPFSSPDSLPVQNDPFSSPASPVQNDPVPQWRETWFRPPLAPRSPNDFPSFDVEAPESPLPSSPGSFVSQPDSPSPATALHSGPIVQPIIPSLRELTAAERDLARGEEMICRALRQMTLEEPGRDIRHHLSPSIRDALLLNEEISYNGDDEELVSNVSPIRAMTKLLAPFEPQRKEKRKESYNT